ncbi:MAG: hypothetical protein FJY82_11440 [Candidatus Aminicenantes bacterium]|nr:hypothetical protein [Candidatus Aminicenantes bacterium]
MSSQPIEEDAGGRRNGPARSTGTGAVKKGRWQMERGEEEREGQGGEEVGAVPEEAGLFLEKELEDGVEQGQPESGFEEIGEGGVHDSLPS